MSSHKICSPCPGYYFFDDDPELDLEEETDYFPDEEENDWRNITPIMTPEALEWSRNRQLEWYELFREEHDLSEDDYVDEQDLLDWLGANFTISRTITQEI